MLPKEIVEALGVAVRAGVVTPSREIEQSVRASLDLPAMAAPVEKEWDENPIRSPITLTNELAAPDMTAAIAQNEV